MTSAEIIKRIVEADKNAREVFDSTTELRKEFDSYMNQRVEKLRRAVFESCDRRIEEAEREIKEKGKEASAASDRKLAAELATAKSQYLEKKETVTEKIFRLTVNADA